MCRSKDPAEYQTLYHIQNEASKHYTAKDSLKNFGDILLNWARDDSAAAEAEPIKLINLSHSPVVTQAKKLNRITQRSTSVVKKLALQEGWVKHPKNVLPE